MVDIARQDPTVRQSAAIVALRYNSNRRGYMAVSS